jgi:hypothetical protein
MGLETGSYIKDLVPTNPQGTDPKSQGDDHLRLIKTVLANQFSGFTEGKPITLNEDQINSQEAASGPSGTPLGSRNVVINGRFQVNQRNYVSGAVLAAGAYGFDRWKAGAAGGDSTFTPNPAGTTITIAAGKSLIQVIEGANISASSFILSWAGTAQARVGLNGAVPSGAYASQNIAITGQSPVSVLSIEFNAGTLDRVQLEVGTVATPYEQRLYSSELSLCQRYFEKIAGETGGAATSLVFGGAATGAYALTMTVFYKVTKRIPPTAVKAGTWGVINSSQPTVINPGINTCLLQMVAVAAGQVQVYTTDSTTYVTLEAEL